MSNLKTVTELFKLSHVPRWAIIDTFKDQTVADHSFRTMAIMVFLTKELDLCSVFDITMEEILMLGMVHDIDESRTGDIPSTYKRELGLPSKPCNPLHLILKLADCTEAYIFCNRYAVQKIPVASDVYKHLKKYADLLETEAEIRGCVFGPGELQTVLNKVIWAGSNHG